MRYDNPVNPVNALCYRHILGKARYTLVDIVAVALYECHCWLAFKCH